MVNVHRVPRSDSSVSANSVPPHRWQGGPAGNATSPQAAHRAPISRGSSEGQVNRPSATGTCRDPVIATLLPAGRAARGTLRWYEAYP